MKHVGTKTIETTRLVLRRLELTDAEMMFRNWTGDDQVTRFLRWDAHKAIDDTKNMIQQWNICSVIRILNELNHLVR